MPPVEQESSQPLDAAELNYLLLRIGGNERITAGEFELHIRPRAIAVLADGGLDSTAALAVTDQLCDVFVYGGTLTGYYIRRFVRDVRKRLEDLVFQAKEGASARAWTAPDWLGDAIPHGALLRDREKLTARDRGRHRKLLALLEAATDARRRHQRWKRPAFLGGWWYHDNLRRHRFLVQHVVDYLAGMDDRLGHAVARCVLHYSELEKPIGYVELVGRCVDEWDPTGAGSNWAEKQLVELQTRIIELDTLSDPASLRAFKHAVWGIGAGSIEAMIEDGMLPTRPLRATARRLVGELLRLVGAGGVVAVVVAAIVDARHSDQVSVDVHVSQRALPAPNDPTPIRSTRDPTLPNQVMPTPQPIEELGPAHAARSSYPPVHTGLTIGAEPAELWEALGTASFELLAPAPASVDAFIETSPWEPPPTEGMVWCEERDRHMTICFPTRTACSESRGREAEESGAMTCRELSFPLLQQHSTFDLDCHCPTVLLIYVGQDFQYAMVNSNCMLTVRGSPVVTTGYFDSHEGQFPKVAVELRTDLLGGTVPGLRHDGLLVHLSNPVTVEGDGVLLPGRWTAQVNGVFEPVEGEADDFVLRLRRDRVKAEFYFAVSGRALMGVAAEKSMLAEQKRTCEPGVQLITLDEDHRSPGSPSPSHEWIQKRSISP